MTKRSLKSRIKRHVTKEFPNAVQENRKIIFFATLLFFLVVATAAVSGQFEGNPISRFVEGATEPSRELFKEEVEVDRSHTQLIFFYIKNNLVTAIESVGLGIAFGIFPLYAILINGLLIGYVITISEFSTLQILSLLVPHGVFELTGFLLAISCGIRLGLGSTLSIKERSFGPLIKSGGMIMNIIPVSISFIVIAGVIEGSLGKFQETVLSSPPIGLILTGSGLSILALLMLWMSGRVF